MQENLINETKFSSDVENVISIRKNQEIQKLIILGELEKLKEYFKDIEILLDSSDKSNAQNFSEFLQFNLNQVLKKADEFYEKEEKDGSLLLYLNCLQTIETFIYNEEINEEFYKMKFSILEKISNIYYLKGDHSKTFNYLRKSLELECYLKDKDKIPNTNKISLRRNFEKYSNMYFLFAENLFEEKNYSNEMKILRQLKKFYDIKYNFDKQDNFNLEKNSNTSEESKSNYLKILSRISACPTKLGNFHESKNRMKIGEKNIPLSSNISEISKTEARNIKLFHKQVLKKFQTIPTQTNPSNISSDDFNSRNSDKIFIKNKKLTLPEIADRIKLNLNPIEVDVKQVSRMNFKKFPKLELINKSSLNKMCSGKNRNSNLISNDDRIGFENKDERENLYLFKNKEIDLMSRFKKLRCNSAKTVKMLSQSNSETKISKDTINEYKKKLIYILNKSKSENNSDLDTNLNLNLELDSSSDTNKRLKTSNTIPVQEHSTENESNSIFAANKSDRYSSNSYAGKNLHNLRKIQIDKPTKKREKPKIPKQDTKNENRINTKENYKIIKENTDFNTSSHNSRSESCIFHTDISKIENEGNSLNVVDINPYPNMIKTLNFSAERKNFKGNSNLMNKNIFNKFSLMIFDKSVNSEIDKPRRKYSKGRREDYSKDLSLKKYKSLGKSALQLDESISPNRKKISELNDSISMIEKKSNYPKKIEMKIFSSEVITRVSAKKFTFKDFHENPEDKIFQNFEKLTETNKNDEMKIFSAINKNNLDTFKNFLNFIRNFVSNLKERTRDLIFIQNIEGKIYKVSLRFLKFNTFKENGEESSFCCELLFDKLAKKNLIQKHKFDIQIDENVFTLKKDEIDKFISTEDVVKSSIWSLLFPFYESFVEKIKINIDNFIAEKFDLFENSIIKRTLQNLEKKLKLAKIERNLNADLMIINELSVNTKIFLKLFTNVNKLNGNFITDSYSTYLNNTKNSENLENSQIIKKLEKEFFNSQRILNSSNLHKILKENSNEGFDFLFKEFMKEKSNLFKFN